MSHRFSPSNSEATIAKDKIKLEIHFFPLTYTSEDIYAVGCRYIQKIFVPRDLHGKRLPFCRTADGKPVWYSTDKNHHILCKDDARQLSMRAQRIHWIRPIIEGRAKGKIHWRDTYERKRIYYLPQLKYVVVLSYDEFDNLSLNTAYRVNRKSARIRLKSQFGQ